MTCPETKPASGLTRYEAVWDLGRGDALVLLEGPAGVAAGGGPGQVADDESRRDGVGGDAVRPEFDGCVHRRIVRDIGGDGEG